MDDIKVIGVKESGHKEKIKRKLAAKFEIVDMGPISFYLGLKVERDHPNKTLKLSQLAYIDKIFSKYHLNLAKPCNTLMIKAIILQNKGSEAINAEWEQWESMTGSLIFLLIETRPDIAFATSMVSRFANNSSRQNTEAVKTITQYLKARQKLGIT